MSPLSPALLGFSATDFLSINRIAFLKKHFGNLENAYTCNDVEEFKKAGVAPKSAQAFLKKKCVFSADRFQETLKQCGAHLLFVEDESYPALLKKIQSPPAFLFVRGNVDFSSFHALAVVGTRKITRIGKQTVEFLIPPLVSAGFTIISGMARGVDAVAHQATIEAEGVTIAVLGNGIDTLYPSEHGVLGERILEHGAIISEFPPGTPPHAFHFPRRNRIIAGLSLGVIVIEAAEKSGSLITAQFALDNNREVFAVPGSPFMSQSIGTNRAIQRGEAKLVMDAQDILQEFSLKQRDAHTAAQKRFPSDPLEKKVFDLLQCEAQFFDELVRMSELNAPALSAVLTMLEIKGFAVHLGGNQWLRKGV